MGMWKKGQGNHWGYVSCRRGVHLRMENNGQVYNEGKTER